MRQRGFGYLELVIVAAIIVALGAAAVELYSTGKETGKQEERAAWLARDNEQLRDAQAALKAEQDKVRALEAKAINDLAAADKDNRKRLADEQKKHDDFIAGVRAGRIVLRDPGKPAAGPQACPGGAPAAAPAAGQPDGAGGARLSGEASEFLWSEAERANLIAVKLTYAQKIIAAYYAACSSP